MTMGVQSAELLDAVQSRARDAGVFGDDIRIENGMLICPAQNPAAPADYRVSVDDSGAPWVELVTADRWLSESVETDLVHTGDKLNELIDEELADLGWEGGASTFEHFRSDELLFTFRSRVPDRSPEAVTTWLLAYEQCFRQLGDIDDSGEDD